MNMKTRKLWFVLCAGIVVAVGAVLVVTTYWARKYNSFQNAPMLLSAVQAFLRDQAAAGQQPPPEVSLPEPILGGYLTAKDAKVFEGMEAAPSARRSMKPHLR
jgi:hypothetical protein